MEAKELLIGKWYNQVIENHKPCLPCPMIWSEHNWSAIGECMEYVEWFEPIPLTENWLKKLGFKLNSAFGTSTYGNGVIGIFFYDGVGSYGIAKFQYVHQLQNLYFALTGTELTVEL